MVWCIYGVGSLLCDGVVHIWCGAYMVWEAYYVMVWCIYGVGCLLCDGVVHIWCGKLIM